MADGRPDLRGIWQAINSANFNLEDHSAELGVPAGQSVVVDGAIPYLDSALEQRRLNYENRATDDPETNCLMPGVPRITYLPYPFQIVQTQDQVTILYEFVHNFRNIKINSEHPPGPIQWWMGDSRASWEGDTLVVDVIHLTDQTWLDRSGNYHSDALHVVERYTMTGPDHILYEATLEDPEVFSEPWKIRMPLYRRMEPTVQILEYECYAYLELQRDAQEDTL
ncbi:MAG: hypothetical protein VYC03_08440 [Pseudomonadota bacterium]|nr:hypothetical protein [Pseudomonadota bacterium]